MEWTSTVIGNALGVLCICVSIGILLRNYFVQTKALKEFEKAELDFEPFEGVLVTASLSGSSLEFSGNGVGGPVDEQDPRGLEPMPIPSKSPNHSFTWTLPSRRKPSHGPVWSHGAYLPFIWVSKLQKQHVTEQNFEDLSAEFHDVAAGIQKEMSRAWLEQKGNARNQSQAYESLLHRIDLLAKSALDVRETQEILVEQVAESKRKTEMLLVRSGRPHIHSRSGRTSSRGTSGRRDQRRRSSNKPTKGSKKTVAKGEGELAAQPSEEQSHE
jgi:hypothetical protein